MYVQLKNTSLWRPIQHEWALGCAPVQHDLSTPQTPFLQTKGSQLHYKTIQKCTIYGLYEMKGDMKAFPAI